MPNKSKICFFGCVVGIMCMVFTINFYWTKKSSVVASRKQNKQCSSKLPVDTITPLKDNKSFIIAPYYDDRERNIIRILAVIHHADVKELYCYLCCSVDSSIYIVKAEIDIHSDRFAFPYGLTDIICPLPTDCRPTYISVHGSPYEDVTQLTKFKIQNLERNEFEANFTVCISTMYGNYSNVLQLIQTIEMYKLLGAQKVMIYLNNCSSQVEDVLQYYVREGTVELIPWQIQRYLKPSRRWRHEADDNTDLGYYGQITTLNDCIYRNMYRSRFVILNDQDEIILPYKHQTWDTMMESLQQQNPEVGIFLFENHIFPQTVATDGNFSDISAWKKVPGFNILQYVHREPDRPDYFNARKMILDPRKVIQTSVHSVLKSYGGFIEVSLEIALVHHCRGPLQPALPKASLIEDKAIWRYNASLIRNVNKVLNHNIF
ncbi:uncharacterized protein WCC33_014732 [Rhinophrynus dorsalis]